LMAVNIHITMIELNALHFFFSSRRRHTRCLSDWSSDVCSSDLALVPAPRPLGARLRGVFGLAALLAIGFGLSSNRRKISWRVIAWGLGLQAAFAVFVLRVPVGQQIGRASCRERVRVEAGAGAWW